MRLEERRTLKLVGGLGALGIVGAVLCFPSLYVVGLWLAPPRPVPEATPAPALLREALWARANGGPATELRPVNPIAIVQHVACTELAENDDDPQQRARRLAECRTHLPAIQGVEYLAGVHMRDHHYEPSFLTGIGRVATAVWITRSWTRESFLDTMAARGEYGFAWRGVHDAARGYFQKPLDQLALHEVATISAMAGDRRADPWCDVDAVIDGRNRILARMRDNGAIADADLAQASSAPLALAPPPADRPPCQK